MLIYIMQRPGIRQSGRLRNLPSSLCEAEKHLHADPKPVQIKQESQLCPIAGEGGRDTKCWNELLPKRKLEPLKPICARKWFVKPLFCALCAVLVNYSDE